MGANHPYPNAPRQRVSDRSRTRFELLRRSCSLLTPGDYSAPMPDLQSSGANYGHLGNTAGSNISLLNACKAAGVDVQSSQLWGMAEMPQGRRCGCRWWCFRCAPGGCLGGIRPA